MKNTEPIRYFVYARKSSDSEDRQIRSIPDQLAEIRALAERSRLEIADIFTESQSARHPGRPVFNDMLKRVEAGEAQGLIFWNPDRISRNSPDNGRFLGLVEGGRIKDLKFCTMQFDMSPSGIYFLSMMLCQSVYYSSNLSTNVRRSFDQMIANGIWPEKAAIGYKNDRSAPGGQIIDPERAAYIHQAYELYATGQYSFLQVRDKLTASGLRTAAGLPVSISKVQFILKNPIYHGVIFWKGEVHEGKFPPIVSKSLFDKVQSVMNARSRLRRIAKKLKPYLFRQVFSCGSCGATITTETQKGHNYLRCTRKRGPCSEPFVREEQIAEQVAQAIQVLALPPAIADWLINELEHEQSQQVAVIDARINDIRTTVRNKSSQISRLVGALSQGLISDNEFREAKNSAVLEKRTLEEQAVKLEKSRLGWLEPAIQFVKASKQATIWLQEENVLKQRDFFRKAGSNRKITNKLITWEPTGAWKTLVNAGRFAHHPGAASHDAAPSSGEPDQHVSKLGD